MFKSIKEEVVGEITEKKSKFICHLYPVDSVEEAEDKIINLRKKYHDARHNCFAYRIYKDGIERSSDDGEPSGTAGAPMLAILNGNNLSNCLAIVTRYFGGILLGTGGLVRAYQDALNDALGKAEIVDVELGKEAIFEVDYNQFEELKYILKNMEVNVAKVSYGEKVEVTVIGPEEKIETLKQNNFSERVKLTNFSFLGERYYYL